LKTAEFTSCLEDGKYKDVVNNQTQFSQSIGVQSTPSFLINGKPVVGAQGFDVFEQYIEDELK
jgi:protein-disulfide isomerase